MTYVSVLHVAAPAPFGGLETVLRALASGQHRQGHRVRVAAVLTPAPSSPTHPFLEALESDAIPTEAIMAGARDYRGERRAIAEICRQFRPDVVHTHGFRPDVVDGAVARQAGAVTVSTCHGFIENHWRGRLYQWIQRRALRRFDAVIAVSTPIAERLRTSGVAPETIHLVPNGFAPRATAMSRAEARRALDVPDSPLIGWVGRLSAEKGPDVAIEALTRLGHQNARLVMIGEGKESDALRARAAALGLGDRVLWRGAVPDAGRLFPAFDAFLLSSRTEGTPMALLEAMAAGVPIVATRVGGVPDVVDAGSAHLVRAGDVDGLARALTDVLEHGEAALGRADVARARLLEQFAVDRWLSRYDSVYQAALAR